MIYTSWFQEYFVVNGSIFGFVSFFTLFGPCRPSKKLSNLISNSLIKQFDASNYHLNGWNCFHNFSFNLSNHHNFCDKGLCFQNVSPLCIVFFNESFPTSSKSFYLKEIWFCKSHSKHMQPPKWKFNFDNPKSSFVWFSQTATSYGNVFTFFCTHSKSWWFVQFNFKTWKFYVFLNPHNDILLFTLLYVKM